MLLFPEAKPLNDIVSVLLLGGGAEAVVSPSLHRKDAPLIALQKTTTNQQTLHKNLTHLKNTISQWFVSFLD